MAPDDEDRRKSLISKMLRERRQGRPALYRHALYQDPFPLPADLLETEPLESLEDELSLVLVGERALERARYAKDLLAHEGYSPGEATLQVLAVLNEKTGVPAAALKELGLLMSVDAKGHLNYPRLNHCVRALERHLPEHAISQLRTREGQRRLYELVQSAIEVHERVREMEIDLSYGQIFKLMIEGGYGAETIVEISERVAARREEDSLHGARMGAYKQLAYRVLDESLRRGCAPMSMLDRELPAADGTPLEDVIRKR